MPNDAVPVINCFQQIPESAKNNNKYNSPIPSQQTYDLRNSRPRPLLGRTNRFNDFIILKFQHVI